VARDGFDGQILHFGSVRYRLTGSGTFRSSLISLNAVNTVTCPDITMQSATNREPTILSNMNEQRAYLRGETTLLNERLDISKIIIYVRPVSTGYPTP